MSQQTTTLSRRFWKAPDIAAHTGLSLESVYHHWRRYRRFCATLKEPRTFPSAAPLSNDDALELIEYINYARQEFVNRRRIKQSLQNY